MKTHPNVLIAALAAAFLVILCAHGASAQYFYTGNSALSITSCSAGFSTLYVTGLAPGSTASFAATGGPLQVQVQPSPSFVSSAGTAQATLAVSAPACFTGNIPVQATATVCEPGSSCQTLSQQIFVSVGQCATSNNDCSTGTVAVTQTGYGNSPDFCNGPGCTYSSQYQHLGNYPPSAYSVAVSRAGANVCLTTSCDFNQAYPGSPLLLSYSVQNAGTPGTFQASLEPFDPQWFSVNPATDSFDLPQAGTSTAYFTVNTNPNTPAGRYEFNIVVMHNNVQVAAVPDWVEIVPQQVGQVQILLPTSGLNVNACSMTGGITVPAQVLVQGNSAQQFTITAQSNGQGAYSSTMTIVPGIASQFALQLPASSLNSGINTVTVLANSGYLSGAGSFQVDVEPCSQSQASVAAQAIPNGSQIVVTATITNQGSSPIDNATATIAGLPSTWSYSAAQVGTIAPGQSVNVTMVVQAGDSSTVAANLIVSSNGAQVASVPLSLSTSSNASGATGLFTAISDPEAFVFLLILLLAVFPGILLARASNNRAGAQPPAAPAPSHTNSHGGPAKPSTAELEAPKLPEDSTSQYLSRMRKLRQQIEESVSAA